MYVQILLALNILLFISAAFKKGLFCWTCYNFKCDYFNGNLERWSIWSCSLCQNILHWGWGNTAGKWLPVSLDFSSYHHQEPLISVLHFVLDFVYLCRYGLAGAVLSNDLERCDRVSKVSYLLLVKKNMSNCTHLTIGFHIFSLRILNIVFSGIRGGYCVGQLFSAMFLSSSMGWNQTQWFWPWTRRMVSFCILLAYNYEEYQHTKRVSNQTYCVHMIH